MTERVYLHVGPHKTGTTYLQGLLMANQAGLAGQGVLFPRESFRGQGRAVREVLGHKSMPTTGRSVQGEWGKLLGEVEEWHGRAAVVSHEVISGATPKEVARLHKTLDAYEVHVVYTARDLARVAPAMWQTGLRSRRAYTWQEYAGALRNPVGTVGGAGRRFWFSQHAPAVLERWRKHLPVANLHVVTVPRPGNPPELLWHRFCTALGVDPTGHDLTPKRSNPSLGTAESELLRRVNAELAGSGMSKTRWLFWVRWLGRELETRTDMARFTLPDEDLGWVQRRAEAVVAGIRDGGYHVIGDLDDLRPQPVPADAARHPGDAPAEAVLDVALDTIRRMMLELAQHGRGADRGPGSDD